MKIALFGANGKTGILLVYQALDKGHTVTAFARQADSVPIRHKNLTVLEGSILDPEAVKRAVAGQDAVLSTLGVNDRNPNTVLSDATRNIVHAMKEAGVQRFICMSSAGILEPDKANLFRRLFQPGALKEIMADKKRQLEVIRESGLQWVVVLPPTLTDAPKTGKYRISDGPPLFKSVPRADVADFMLRLLNDKRYDGTTPSIAGY